MTEPVRRRPLAQNLDANSASVERNILAVSRLERRALENRTAAERLSDAVVAYAGRLGSGEEGDTERTPKKSQARMTAVAADGQRRSR